MMRLPTRRGTEGESVSWSFRSLPLLFNDMESDMMVDPLKQLEESKKIGFALIKLKRATPQIEGEMGHPVDDALRAIVIVRQRLFGVYGQQMYLDAEQMDELVEELKLTKEPKHE